MPSARHRSPVPNAQDIEMTALGLPGSTLTSPVLPSASAIGPPLIYYATSRRARSTDLSVTDPETVMRGEIKRPILDWCNHEMQAIPMVYKILSSFVSLAFMGLLWIYLKELPHHALESDADWTSEKAAHTRGVAIMTALVLVLIVGMFIICLYCAREGTRLGEEDVRRERTRRDMRARQPKPLTGAERRTMQRQQRRQLDQEQVINNLTRAGII